jgi:hypothetical protein
MPTPLPSDQVALELAIRSAIVAEMDAIDEGQDVRARVHPVPYFVEGDAQWLEVAGTKRDKVPETRVVFVSFLGFGEKPEGKCDNTQLTLSYDLDVLFSQVNKRRDGSNSHDDFVAYLMKARARFKANRDFGYSPGLAEHNLLQTSEPAHVEKTDFATVHRTHLSLDVVIDL